MPLIFICLVHIFLQNNSNLMSSDCEIQYYCSNMCLCPIYTKQPVSHACDHNWHGIRPSLLLSHNSLVYFIQEHPHTNRTCFNRHSYNAGGHPFKYSTAQQNNNRREAVSVNETLGLFNTNQYMYFWSATTVARFFTVH